MHRKFGAFDTYSVWWTEKVSNHIKRQTECGCTVERDEKRQSSDQQKRHILRRTDSYRAPNECVNMNHQREKKINDTILFQDRYRPTTHEKLATKFQRFKVEEKKKL